MAKYMGIDYGAKRVGVAVSDETGSVAFPRGIFTNDSTLIPRLRDLVRDEGITYAVVGESKDKDGKDNPVMKEVYAFAEALERAVALTVYFEAEYYSSVEARRDATTSFIDDKAATVILNRYLERLKNRHGDID
jgi:putative Holliday junction resolvase